MGSFMCPHPGCTRWQLPGDDMWCEEHQPAPANSPASPDSSELEALRELERVVLSQLKTEYVCHSSEDAMECPCRETREALATLAELRAKGGTG